jgi:hypothetical protein
LGTNDWLKSSPSLDATKGASPAPDGGAFLSAGARALAKPSIQHTECTARPAQKAKGGGTRRRATPPHTSRRRPLERARGSKFHHIPDCTGRNYCARRLSRVGLGEKVGGAKSAALCLRRAGAKIITEWKTRTTIPNYFGAIELIHFSLVILGNTRNWLVPAARKLRPQPPMQ